VVVALAAPACGREDAGNGDRDALSAAEFRQQADAACLRFYERIDALGSQPSSADEFAAWAAESLRILREGHAELRQLVPPESLVETWNEGLALNDEIDELLEEQVDAVKEEDVARFQELQEQIQSKNAEAGQRAREVGLEECG